MGKQITNQKVDDRIMGEFEKIKSPDDKTHVETWEIAK